MKTKYVFFLLLLIFILPACNNCEDDQTDCPGLHSEYADWVELHANTSLNFENAAEEKRSFESGSTITEQMTRTDCNSASRGACSCTICISEVRLQLNRTNSIDGNNLVMTYRLTSNEAVPFQYIELLSAGIGVVQLNLPPTFEWLTPSSTTLGERSYEDISKFTYTYPDGEKGTFYLSEKLGLIAFTEVGNSDMFYRVW